MMSDAATSAIGFAGRLALRAWSPAEIKAAGRSAQQYDLLESFSYTSPRYGLTVVPVGFCTDFASIPRFAWSYIDPEDPAILMPSIIHDYLYSTQGARVDSPVLSRQDVDEQLAFECMPLCGARWDQQHVVYAAVRAGGASHWTA